jgi:ubiquinone/menaquinone biosynthesis C-methylase UbiE
VATRDELLEDTRRAEATHFWFEGFRRFVAPMLRQVADGRRDLRLLDCGCGTGANLAMLREHGRAYGFDLLAGSTTDARGRLARADVTRIPFRTGTFDVATAFDVLQCVDRDELAVAEMARVTRPGGAIVLTLAALDMLRGDHAEAWHELRRYTPARAERLVRAANLEVRHVSFMFGSVFPLMLGVRLAQRLSRPFRTEPVRMDMAIPPAPVNAALRAAVRAEAALARYVSLPVGSSLLVVASK